MWVVQSVRDKLLVMRKQLHFVARLRFPFNPRNGTGKDPRVTTEERQRASSFDNDLRDTHCVATIAWLIRQAVKSFVSAIL